MLSLITQLDEGDWGCEPRMSKRIGGATLVHYHFENSVDCVY